MSEEREGDVALKLLHTADWHLGMRFPSFPEKDQTTLMRARMSVIDRIFGLAHGNRVDAVLCAGDLFDEPAPEESWWRGLLDRLRVHADPARPIVLLPGNHDPYTNTSVWHPSHPFRRDLPAGVHVVDADDFTLSLGPEAVLHAAPCRTAAGQAGLWKLLPPREPGDERIRVGMVHGQTFDIPGHQMNFPIPADAPERCGVDYLAIGDTHAFREVPPDARYPMVYPGAPEPTRFGDTEAGYVALVFFPRGRRRPILRRERVGHWRWEDRKLTTLAELEALARDESLRQAVLRLRLDMRVAPAEYEAVEQRLRELAGTDATHGKAGVLQVDRTRLELDTRDVEAAFRELPDVLLAAIQTLRAQETGLVGDPAKRALYHLYCLVKEAR